MSGHNKWSQIKHKKGAEDARRSKIFSKLVRVIAVEAKKANGNVNDPGLRAAIEKAKQANMPAGNIERAIKKGGEKDTLSMEEVIYEAYGPAGCALVILGLTDNKNRAVQEIKHILSKNGSALSASGSALWAFDKTSEGYIPKTTVDIPIDDQNTLGTMIDELEDIEDVQEVYTNAA